MMSLSDTEKQERKTKKWKRAGKGRGNRWLMLRDVVAYCAIRPWTTTEVEDLNVSRRGIIHRTTYGMILELERAQMIESFSEERGQYWRATVKGVNVFVGTRQGIPATLVQEVLTIGNVHPLEKLLPLRKNREND